MKHLSEALVGVAFLALVGFVVYLGFANAKTVAVGLDCQGDRVRVYSADDEGKAAKVCRVVELHKVP